MQSLGLSRQYGKKDSNVSQFLMTILGLSLLPPAEVSDCFALDFISNIPNDKRMAEFCDYLLENYIDADSTFPPPVCSESSASSLRTVNACESLHAHFNAIFYSALPNIFVLVSAFQKMQNETCIKMRSLTTRRPKNSATLKKEEFISPKIGQHKLNLISRIEFVSTVSYTFLPNTHLYFLIACIHDDTCTTVNVRVTAQKIADNTHVKPHWAKRSEVGSYTF